MKDVLLEFLENSFDNKKLKKSRLKRKLSLAEVADKTGIPTTTLQRYEDGVTKKVPFEAIKKLCKLYKTDYNCYYTWTSFPLFGTLGGMLISLFFGVSVNSLQNGTIIGGLLGFNSMMGVEKIFTNLSSKKQNPKKIIYDSLTKEEKKRYKNFKTIATTHLETDEIIDGVEKEEVDNLLFAVYMMHEIRKKEKRKNVELKDYYSYYSINGLSKDSNNKLLRVDSEIQDLILENQALNGKVEVLDEMLHNFKPTQKQIVIPNIANEGVDIEDKNDYYSKLVEDYVALNNNIEDNKVKIQLLENSKVDIKAPSAEEIKNLDDKLRVVVEKANKIIEDMNILSREYIDSTYSDMIKIVSPVTTDTEGKPLILFVGVGAVLGIMLGVFLAFMAEFIRNYRNKYSK